MFTPFVLLLACLMASTASVAASNCQLCPANSTLQGSSNPIPPHLFPTPVPVATCGEIDSLLSRLPFGSQCNKTLSPFLKIFDAQYYCQCSGVTSPGVCPVCSTITNTNGIFSTGRLANFTCTEANRFVASLATSGLCASNELISFCCPGEATSTMAPTPTSSGTSVTMAPASAGTSSSSTSTGTCQICPANSTLTAGSNALPSGLVPTSSPVATCSQLDSFLKSFRFHTLCTRALTRVEKLVDVQYYCGCSGMSTGPPGVCQMCQNVTNVNALIPKGRYANLTCLEANKFFAALPSGVTCPASYFTKICCPSEHIASKSPSGTVGPTPAGMTMTPSMLSSMTMIPSSMNGTTTAAPAGNGSTSTMTPTSAGSTKASAPGSPTQPTTTTSAAAAIVATSLPWSRVGSGMVLIMLMMTTGGGSLADLMW